MPPLDSSVEDYRFAVRQLWHRHPTAVGEESAAAWGEEEAADGREEEEDGEVGGADLREVARGAESETDIL